MYERSRLHTAVTAASSSIGLALACELVDHDFDVAVAAANLVPRTARHGDARR